MVVMLDAEHENGVEFDDDNDGVPNSIDLEPNTPQGVIVNKFGISSAFACAPKPQGIY